MERTWKSLELFPVPFNWCKNVYNYQILFSFSIETVVLSVLKSSSDFSLIQLEKSAVVIINNFNF